MPRLSGRITTFVCQSQAIESASHNGFTTITCEVPPRRAANVPLTRPLVPATGPTVWRRCESTNAAGGQKGSDRSIFPDQSSFSEQSPSEPSASSAPVSERWKGRSTETFKPLRTGSAQQELGQQLRKSLHQGRDLTDIFGDPEIVQRKYGIQLGGPRRKQRMVRQRMEHAAAATAVLGKYRGSAISSQYVQDNDLSNELDGILQEDGKEVSAFEHLEADPGLKITTAQKIRSKTKQQSPSWEKLGDFERRLYRNPYAKQLASPLRQCGLTGMRLPNALMTPFSLKWDSESTNLWVVPAGFYLSRHEWPYTSDFDPLGLKAAVPRVEKLPPLEADADEDATVGVDDPLEAPHLDLLRSKYALRRVHRTYPRDHDDAGEDTSRPARRNTSASDIRLWTVSSPRHLTGIGLLTTTNEYKRFIPPAWQRKVGRKVYHSNIRKDFPEHILKLMRRRASRLLAFMVHTCQGVVLPLETSDSEAFQTAAGVPSTTVPNSIGRRVRKLAKAFAGGADPAAVLWFGESWGDQFPYTEDKISAEVSERASENVNQAQVPIYNMQQLLSKIEWDWLRTLKWSDEKGEHETAFTARQVLVKESLWSFHSLNWLWRLQLTTSFGDK